MKFLLTDQETDRLRFRKLEHSDFEFWMELFKDEETTRNLGMSEFKNAEECCEKWFEWTFHRYEIILADKTLSSAKKPIS